MKIQKTHLYKINKFRKIILTKTQEKTNTQISLKINQTQKFKHN